MEHEIIKCDVYEQNDRLFFIFGVETLKLSEAVNRPSFAGYVIDGRLVSHSRNAYPLGSPREPAAAIPQHVLFSVEVKKPTTMTFAEAVEEMKEGKKVGREDWEVTFIDKNSKMYVLETDDLAATDWVVVE